MGSVTALLCVVGFVKSEWILNNTKKGERLIGWFGAGRAIWILRSLLVFGAVFGVLLAINIIRPVQW